MDSASAKTVTTQILTLVYELPGALEFLECLTHYMPSATLVGGAIRDLWIDPHAVPKDLDIMVEDDEINDAAVDALGKHYEVGENEYGNPKIDLGSMTADVFSPGRFRPGFDTITESLQNFDCTINAVGIRLHELEFLDPMKGTYGLDTLQTSLIPARWDDPSEGQAWLLLSRLSRLRRKYPELAVTNLEIATDLAEFWEWEFPMEDDEPKPEAVAPTEMVSFSPAIKLSGIKLSWKDLNPT
jgi:hypothetical protein